MRSGCRQGGFVVVFFFFSGVVGVMASRPATSALVFVTHATSGEYEEIGTGKSVLPRNSYADDDENNQDFIINLNRSRRFAF